MEKIIEGDGSIIVTQDGTIQTIFQIDRERIGRYIFNVQAVDSGFPRKTSITKVTVTVADRNDNAPIFEEPDYMVSVDENLPMGTTVIRVSAEDSDAGLNAELTYRFSSPEGFPTNLFGINPVTGLISVFGVIDREEAGSEIILEVKAVDRGVPALSTSVYVRVIVKDLNDNGPVFTPQFYSSIISNTDSSERVLIATIKAEDADSGSNGEVSFSLVDDDSHNFFMDEKTGEISSVKGAILSTGEVILLKALATDQGYPIKLSQTHAMIRVDVIDGSDVLIEFDMVIFDEMDVVMEQLRKRVNGPNGREIILKLYKTEPLASGDQIRNKRTSRIVTRLWLYALYSNNTEEISAIGKEKELVPSDLLRKALDQSPAGIWPAGDIVEASDGEVITTEFDSKSLKDDKRTSMSAAHTGIVVFGVFMVILLALIGILVYKTFTLNRERRAGTEGRI